MPNSVVQLDREEACHFLVTYCTAPHILTADKEKLMLEIFDQIFKQGKISGINESVLNDLSGEKG